MARYGVRPLPSVRAAPPRKREESTPDFGKSAPIVGGEMAGVEVKNHPSGKVPGRPIFVIPMKEESRAIARILRVIFIASPSGAWWPASTIIPVESFELGA